MCLVNTFFYSDAIRDGYYKYRDVFIIKGKSTVEKRTEDTVLNHLTSSIRIMISKQAPMCIRIKLYNDGFIVIIFFFLMTSDSII